MERPRLTSDLTSAEFLRWYWLTNELANFARILGIRTSGGKVVLTQRISAHLDGREFVESPALRKSPSLQLSAPLTPDTRIPLGQRSSQTLRAWFAEQLGPSFHFDAHMRAFITETDGTRTLADALEHWHRTRTSERKLIGDQFEYNRFTRAWHEENPNGSQSELLVAWREYRSRPVDDRGRI